MRERNFFWITTLFHELALTICLPRGVQKHFQVVSSVVHWRVFESLLQIIYQQHQDSISSGKENRVFLFLCDDATITGYSDCAIAGAYEEGWSCSSVVGILSAAVESDLEMGRRYRKMSFFLDSCVNAASGSTLNSSLNRTLTFCAKYEFSL